MFVFTFFRHLTPYCNKFTLNTSCSYRRTLDESCSGLVQKKWVGCLQKAVNDVTRKDIHCRYSVQHVKDLLETWVILLQWWQHLAPTNVARDLLSVDTISIHFRKFSLRFSRLFSSVFPGNRRIKGEPRVLDIILVRSSVPFLHIRAQKEWKSFPWLSGFPGISGKSGEISHSWLFQGFFLAFPHRKPEILPWNSALLFAG